MANQMPEIDGLEASRRIRVREKQQTRDASPAPASIDALTAHAFQHAVRSFFEVG